MLLFLHAKKAQFSWSQLNEREDHTVSSKVEILVPINSSNSSFPSAIMMMPVKFQAKLIIINAKNQTLIFQKLSIDEIKCRRKAAFTQPPHGIWRLLSRIHCFAVSEMPSTLLYSPFPSLPSLLCIFLSASSSINVQNRVLLVCFCG